MVPAEYTIHGFVTPGFEPVEEAFEKHFQDGLEDKAQVCAYVRGKKVVDLWGQVARNSSFVSYYGPDAVQNVFSSGKSITSLVVAMLVDRGHLKYDERIAEIWPDFVQRNDSIKYSKENATIAHLMRHELGIPEFSHKPELAALTTDNIRAGAVSDFIALQQPIHTVGNKRVYHSLTRGYIANEVVRRADPLGRTIGQFVEEEVATPLDLSHELSVGAKDDSKVAALTHNPLWETWRQMLLPRALGGNKVPVSNIWIRLLVLAGVPFLHMHHWLTRPANSTDLGVGASILAEANSAAWRKAEIPSANLHASARALAKVAATIVDGGRLRDSLCDGFRDCGAASASPSHQHRYRLLSAEGVRRAHGGVVNHTMFDGYLDSRFGNAGWNDFGPGRFGYIGWMGAGGSAMMWQPRNRIGFGYAMNLMELTPGNERARKLQRVVAQCAESERKKEKEEEEEEGP